MVARWLQQKLIKQKRMRRAWAKPYSMRSTGPAVMPGYIADDGQFKSTSIGSRAKAGGTVVDPWLETLFKDRNPLYTRTESNGYMPNEAGIHARSQGSNAVPRAVVLAKLIQSTSNAGSLQGETVFNYIKLIGGQFFELRLYFGGNQYFFLERVTRGTTRRIRRSILYGDKGRAMWAFNEGKISWMERIEEASPPQPGALAPKAATRPDC